MSPGSAYRGQPLVALLLLFGGWVTMRVIAWEAQAASLPTPAPRPAAALAWGGAAAVEQSASTSTAHGEPAAVNARPAVRTLPAAKQGFSPPSAQSVPFRPSAAPLLRPLRRAFDPPAAALPATQPLPIVPSMSAEQQLLWMAALAQLPVPASLLTPPTSAAAATDPAPAPQPASRWSGDGWLLLRRGGSASPVGGLGPSTYGASQAGAVLRYRLAPDSAHGPALYLRASAALNGSREREAALGASARPIAHLPIAVAAEARVNDQPGATRVRPAAFAYTELPPVALPFGAQAELYAQAGYVGGNFATAFVDGQLRVDRRFVRIGRGELRAGGGAWGGAQKGASRLDLGPSATFSMPLRGSAAARLGFDWRFRVAGDAAPASGPALTLSAGF